MNSLHCANLNPACSLLRTLFPINDGLRSGTEPSLLMLVMNHYEIHWPKYPQPPALLRIKRIIEREREYSSMFVTNDGCAISDAHSPHLWKRLDYKRAFLGIARFPRSFWVLMDWRRTAVSLSQGAHSKLFFGVNTPYYFCYNFRCFQTFLIVRWTGQLAQPSIATLFFILFFFFFFSQQKGCCLPPPHHTHGILGLQDIVVSLASKTRARRSGKRIKAYKMHIEITFASSCILGESESRRLNNILLVFTF